MHFILASLLPYFIVQVYSSEVVYETRPDVQLMPINHSLAGRSFSNGDLLYREQQLGPDLMNRSNPADVLNKYAEQQRKYNELIRNLTNGAGSGIIGSQGSKNPGKLITSV